MITVRGSRSKSSSATVEIIDGAKIDTEQKEEKEEVWNFDYVFALNRWSLRLLGLWPLDTQFFSDLRCMVNFTLTVAVMIPVALYLLIILTDRKELTDHLSYVVTYIPLLSRFVLIRMNSENLRIILHRMNIDWTNYRHLPKQQQRRMIHYVKIGRLLNIITFLWTIIALIGFLLLPVLQTWVNGLPWNSTTKQLPTKIIFSVLFEQSPAFEIMFLAQCIMGCIFGLTVISTDNLFYVLVFHACGQFEVLAMRFQRYAFDTIKHVYTQNTRSCICACLSCIVKQHVHIISYMNLIEDTFNIFILIQLIGYILTLAIHGYKIIAFANDYDVIGFFTYIMYGIELTYTLFVYCYIGECIIEKSENIGKIAYNLEWNYFRHNYALFIILIMARSKRPCKITAGKFVTICLSYYKKVLITTISYISVLRQFNK